MLQHIMGLYQVHLQAVEALNTEIFKCIFFEFLMISVILCAKIIHTSKHIVYIKNKHKTILSINMKLETTKNFHKIHLTTSFIHIYIQ
jgi:hypothetical protein